MANPNNSMLVSEFYQYMKYNGASERHMNNNLKAIMGFSNFIGRDVSLLNVRQKEQLIAFLDTKIKTSEEDPEKKWITTWNHYLAHIKYFFRWLHNHRSNNIQAISEETLQQSEWQTPLFAQIKKKKTKRLSPYSDIELWD
jgi:integrase/recombinase XerD